MFTVLALMQLCDNMKSRENLPCPLCLLRILLTPFSKRNAIRRCQVRLPLVPGFRLLYGSRSPSGRRDPVDQYVRKLIHRHTPNSETKDGSTLSRGTVTFIWLSTGRTKQKPSYNLLSTLENHGGCGGDRTRNLRFRKPTLCPVELHIHDARLFRPSRPEFLIHRTQMVAATGFEPAWVPMSARPLVLRNDAWS